MSGQPDLVPGAIVGCDVDKRSDFTPSWLHVDLIDRWLD